MTNCTKTLGRYVNKSIFPALHQLLFILHSNKKEASNVFQKFVFYLFHYISFSQVHLIRVRSSHPEVFCKKGVLRNFAKFTGKHLFKSLFFDKNAGLGKVTLLKSAFDMGVLLDICCIFSEHLFLKHLWEAASTIW